MQPDIQILRVLFQILRRLVVICLLQLSLFTLLRLVCYQGQRTTPKSDEACFYPPGLWVKVREHVLKTKTFAQCWNCPSITPTNILRPIHFGKWEFFFLRDGYAYSTFPNLELNNTISSANFCLQVCCGKGHTQRLEWKRSP